MEYIDTVPMYNSSIYPDVHIEGNVEVSGEVPENEDEISRQLFAVLAPLAFVFVIFIILMFFIAHILRWVTLKYFLLYKI